MWCDEIWCDVWLVQYICRNRLIYGNESNSLHYNPIQSTGEQHSTPEIHLWDACTATPIKIFQHTHRNSVISLCFSQSAEHLASIGTYNAVQCSISHVQYRPTRISPHTSHYLYESCILFSSNFTSMSWQSVYCITLFIIPFRGGFFAQPGGVPISQQNMDWR